MMTTDQPFQTISGSPFMQLARKLLASLFLIAVVMVPVVIVALEARPGGLWVAGYVTGIVTVPLIAIGALRAISLLADSLDIEVFVAVVIFGIFVLTVSAASAAWALFG